MKFDYTFHRTLYVFACKKGSCHKASGQFKVLRAQLPKVNKIYEENENGEYYLKSTVMKGLNRIFQLHI